MNVIFLAIVAIAFVMGAVRQIAWDGLGEAPMSLLGKAMIDAAGGAVTLAIGLAMQGTLSNIAAGVMIIAFRPYSVGDWVEVAGVSGSVRELYGEIQVPDTPPPPSPREAQLEERMQSQQRELERMKKLASNMLPH